MKLGLAMGINARAENLETMGGFEPADISNLDIHYDFSLLSGSDGAAVSDVSNLGAAGSDYDMSQGTEALQPTIDASTLNAKSLEFANDGDRLNLDNPYTTTGETFTIWLAYKVSNTTDTDALAGGISGSNNGLFRYSNANAIIFKCNGDGNNTNTHTSINCNNTNNSTVQHTFTTNTEVLIITRDAAEEIRVYNQDGDYIGLGTSVNTSGNTNFILDNIGAFSNSSNPLGGQIGEFGMYNKTLSASEAASLAEYLKDKWI